MNATSDIISSPTDLGGAAEPCLQIKLGGEFVARCVLNRPRITLGRSRRSDVVLDGSGGVSRHHAHILIVDGEALIEDLSSRNGTMVNGRVCKRRTLKHGDRIRIGRYKMRYRNAPAQAGPDAPEREPVSALLRLWAGAAVTEPFRTCAQCRDVHAAEITVSREETPTDALPCLVDETAEAEPQENPSPEVAADQTDVEQKRPATVPTGVATSGDTLDGLAVYFYL